MQWSRKSGNIKSEILGKSQREDDSEVNILKMVVGMLDLPLNI